MSAKSTRPSGTCHLCGQICLLSEEHVPHKKAFNQERTISYGMTDWLERSRTGTFQRKGPIQQGGVRHYTLCEDCNNKTGHWYGNEYVKWSHIAVGILQQHFSDPDSLNKDPDPKWARLIFKQVYPLRFLKAVTTSLFSVNSPEFQESHPDLATFVLDKDCMGLPDRYKFYLSLFLGPISRYVGVAGRRDVNSGLMAYLTEFSYPPFSCLLTINTSQFVQPCGVISGFADYGYDQCTDIEIDVLVGFGHMPYPGDYRSQAAIDTDQVKSVGRLTAKPTYKAGGNPPRSRLNKQTPE